MTPRLEKFVSQYDNLELVKIDADLDSNADYLDQYDVRSIPTLVLEDETGKVLGVKIGELSEDQLSSWVAEVMDSVQ